MTEAAKAIIEARHPEGERFVYNEAEGVSPAFEDGAYSCNAVALGASHNNSYVDIPVDANTEAILYYDRANEEFKYTTMEMVLNGTFDENIDDWVTPVWIDGEAEISGSTIYGDYQIVPTISGFEYFVTGRARIVTAVSTGIRICEDGASGTILAESPTTTSLTMVGLEVTFDATSANSAVYLRNNARNVTSIWDDITMRPTSMYRMELSGSDYTKLTEIPTQADLDYLTANPEALRIMVVTGVDDTNLSFGNADIQDSPWFGNEGQRGGDTLYNYAQDDNLTIEDYQASCRTTYENEKTGVSNLPFVQDSSGVITAKTDANTMATDDGGKYIDTGIKPNLDAMTITQRISGELQDFGSELVVNGTFDTATTGWTADSATLSVDTQRLKITSAGTYASAEQTISGLDETKTYKLVGEFTKGSVANVSIQVRDEADTTNIEVIPLSISTDFQVSFSPEAGETSVILRFIANPGSTGQTQFYDNVSIKEDLGLIQRTEKREHTWDDEAVTESYRIDDVEQSYTPARPSTTATLKCSELPMIGYQDDITLHHDVVRIRTVSDTIAASVALDQAYYEEHYPITENGNAITSDGENLYFRP